jgi:hypothetical protein
LNAVYPSLESAWFRVISYQAISWFQNVPFKCKLQRYNADANSADAQKWIDEWKGDGPAPSVGGAVQVVNPVDAHSLKPLGYGFNH